MEQKLHQLDPILQRAMAVDSCCRDVYKQELQVAYHEVLVVQMRLAKMLGTIAACRKHLAGWTIKGGMDYFANEVELTCCNHILDGRCVIEYGANFLLPYLHISHLLH